MTVMNTLFRKLISDDILEIYDALPLMNPRGEEKLEEIK